MPAWILLVTRDSLRAASLEQEIRLAGFSPRRAPDSPRAEVLLAQGEPPIAVVVDVDDDDRSQLDDLLRLRPALPRDVLVVSAAETSPWGSRQLRSLGARIVTRGTARGELAAELRALGDARRD
ncbi:MAG: hypothetical protein JSV80_12965 [Acidobacteriota bacterium]|nr:MAG: hypothetical protein JSV80_12965 [Acidobacteriota bacterium]